MSMEAEILADRRRLKRKLMIWRIAGGLLVFLFIAGSVLGSSANNGGFWAPEQIARLTISGVITDDRKQQKLLQKIANSEKVKAVIVHINSPGGTTTGGEALYEQLNKIREKKPVVAVFGTVAASAAYMTAMATDHIVARANTITGSVGVIFQWANFTELLKNVGVKVEEIKSGPLKATPSPFQKTDEASLKVASQMVDESFQWFFNLVLKERKLKAEDVPGLKAGRVYLGMEAKNLGLVDEIGGEETAIAWLEKEKKIAKDLPVKDWKVEKSSSLSLLTGLVRTGGALIGLDASSLAQALSYDEARRRMQLTGLVSIWRPNFSSQQ